LGRRSFTKEAECQLGVDGCSVKKRIFATSISDLEGSKLVGIVKSWGKEQLREILPCFPLGLK